MTAPSDPVERFARVTPPRDHARRVLARSGPAAWRVPPEQTPDGDAPRRPATRRVRRLAAAAALVAAGLVVARDVRLARDLDVMPPVAGAEWGGKGVDVPVLPPRAYWEMSAIGEFERLRPPPRPSRQSPPHEASAAATRASAGVGGTIAAWADIAPIEIDAIEAAPVTIEALAVPPAIDIAPVVIDPVVVTPVTEEEQ